MYYNSYNNAAAIRIYFCEWDRQSGAPSHDLLKRAVEAYLDERQESFIVCTDGNHGKPYIRELPDVHFSITHEGGYWLCAVGRVEMGLDLQKVRDRDMEQIAERFFHPSEIAWLKQQNSREAFFRLWAEKESYVKYTGKGLTEGLDYFSVVDGLPAFQQEIPFSEDAFLILTTQRGQDAVTEELR